MAIPSTQKTGKRYYLATQDMRKDPSDFRLDKSAFIDGKTGGTHGHLIHGSEVRRRFGVPPVHHRPRLVVAEGGRKPLDMYGYGRRFLSTPAKNLLSEIDGEAFEFLECETTDSKGNPVDSYWMFDVIRVVHEFDEASSSFVRYADIDPEDAAATGNTTLLKLNEIRFLDDLPESYHAFWLSRHGAHPIFDNEIVDRWRALGLTGAQFTPLQEPTRLDMKEHVQFANFPYWTDKVKTK